MIIAQINTEVVAVVCVHFKVCYEFGHWETKGQPTELEGGAGSEWMISVALATTTGNELAA